MRSSLRAHQVFRVSAYSLNEGIDTQTEGVCAAVTLGIDPVSGPMLNTVVTSTGTGAVGRIVLVGGSSREQGNRNAVQLVLGH